MEYAVLWMIDVDADDPRSAAQQAFDAVRRPDTIATVFHVRPRESGPTVVIDLSNNEEAT